jgi:hypothetical protein
MTPEQLVQLVAVLLSLLVAYIPGFSGWFEGLSLSKKLLVQAGFLALTTAVLYGLSCAGLYAVFACTWAGVWAAVVLWAKALLLNQGVYQTLVRLPRKVFGVG